MDAVRFGLEIWKKGNVTLCNILLAFEIANDDFCS